MRTESEWPGVEQLLAAHPEFGDSLAIQRRSLARLRVGTALLATQLPALSQNLHAVSADRDESLAALLHDPVLRNAFEADLGLAAEGVLEGRSQLARFLPVLRTRRSYGEIALEDAWPRHGAAAVWTEVERPGADDVGSTRLWGLLDGVFPASTGQAPIKPSAGQLDMLRRAAELLVAVLPGLGPSVLRHIGLVILAYEESPDGLMHSASGGDPFPATVFIAPEELDDPWYAAGALLHEGLHLLLFEVIRCGAMVVDGADVDQSAVPIPWRKQDWSVVRALFALHVYTHLVLFDEAARCAPAELRAGYGEPPASIALSDSTEVAGYETAAQRARHLADALQNRPGLLTPYGRQFVDWLADALDRLAPADRNAWLSNSYQAVKPAAAVHLPDQQRVVLAMTEPARLLWLNATSWLIYALCDGRDAESIRAEYVALVDRAVPRDEAEQHLAAGLPDLVSLGLVAARP